MVQYKTDALKCNAIYILYYCDPMTIDQEFQVYNFMVIQWSYNPRFTVFSQMACNGEVKSEQDMSTKKSTKASHEEVGPGQI